jgi:hypothetical protein
MRLFSARNLEKIAVNILLYAVGGTSVRASLARVGSPRGFSPPVTS